MDAQLLMFTLLRGVVCGQMPDKGTMESCSPELLRKTFDLAAGHDLAHLTAHCISKLGIPSCMIPEEHRQDVSVSLLRYAKLNHECKRVYGIFAEEKIPFLPLKGTVLRTFYPEPWMRTSCDIDILIREEHLPAAIRALQEKADYHQKGSTSVDISLYSPNGVHLELHHGTIEGTVSDKAEAVLADIWELAIPDAKDPYCYRLDDPLFYYYHIAHMAKHVLYGGCGIRSFLDVWILNERMTYDREARNILLQKGGLVGFAMAAEKLARVWFSDEAPDAADLRFADYILSGGVYGTGKNRITLDQYRKGGKLKYALFRVFQPYRLLKEYYPILEKYKILTPVFQVVRWLRVLFKGRLRHSVNELKTTAAVDQSDTERARSLLNYLSL